MIFVPYFLQFSERKIIILKYNCLEEVKNVYGENNLVKLVNLKQILVYIKTIQPVFIDEGYDHKLICYFVKSETKECWEKWKASNPNK